ncbi:TolA family protein [Ahrensia sp. R2A130]|uniref:TolA family protein n=1 Tax=Ahrensia sp. R2A130 TaxID=744979 RepID=UPI0001E0F89C|nr:TolA family protein [Ahrensia sp. R2A130]EFL89033.1 TolA family protein [Ahrensia sp. R2A130]
MVSLSIQTVLLIAIAFILGCVIGSLLRWLFTSGSESTQSEPKIADERDAKPAKVAAPSEPVRVGKKLEPTAPKPVVPIAPAEKATVAKQAPLPDIEPVANAEPVPAFVAVTPPEGPSDNLKLVRGIGPQNEARLNALGITQFSQIAKWSAKEQRAVGEALAFPGRIEREEWTQQAVLLAKGEKTDFSKRVASGDVSSSMGTAGVGDIGTKPSGTLIEARGGAPDKLTLIDGVGNAIEKKMFKLGIYHFDQLAQMSNDELVWLGNALGFPGRPERENWKGESGALASGASPTDAEKPAARGAIKTSRGGSKRKE